MRVLGLSGHFHDAAAALVVDGKMVAFAQEERFSRRKHDSATPMRAANFCLAEAGIPASSLDRVVWHEKPLLKFERVLLTLLRTFPRSSTVFRRAMVSMVGDRLWIRGQLAERLKLPLEKIQFSSHHASHAAAAFLTSPFPEAAVLCVDGVGEWATTSVWKGDGNTLTPAGEIHFPHSIGLLYSVFTAFLGFEVNDGEYKVMGLSAFGKPKYQAEVEKLVRRSADGSFELDLSYFCYDRDPDHSWTPAFETLFGAPRVPGGPMEDRHRDLAASIQVVTEELMLGLCKMAKEKTGSKYLCLAGGVALNAVAVGRIVREGPFEDVYVMPAAGDSGSALGAALLGHDNARSLLDRPGWGSGIDPAAVKRLLSEGGISHSEPADIAVEVGKRLAAGEVIGWMQGRFEIGPRALGHRSILSDPRSAEAKERLNRRVKFREPFRPFAPSVLVEESDRYFEIPKSGSWTRRFMTSTVNAKEGHGVPAAVHVDETARVQEVHRDVQPLYAAMLDSFKAETGFGCVVNTSFNLAGEPMVATPADGWATFLRSGIDALAVGPYIVQKNG